MGSVIFLFNVVLLSFQGLSMLVPRPPRLAHSRPRFQQGRSGRRTVHVPARRRQSIVFDEGLVLLFMLASGQRFSFWTAGACLVALRALVLVGVLVEAPRHQKSGVQVHDR